LLAVGTVSAAAVAKLSCKGGTVRFHATGPAGLDIDGTGGGVTVDENDGKLTITASTKGLDTKMNLRNKHLAERIEADKFPKATLVVERSKLKMPEKDKPSKGEVSGQLTFHGVTKTVPIKYKARLQGEKGIAVEGVTRIDITQYKIEQPCYLGVCVKPNVDIAVSFTLQDK
jgi:polyisoprenoid-binding protein YceI